MRPFFIPLLFVGVALTVGLAGSGDELIARFTGRDPSMGPGSWKAQTLWDIEARQGADASGARITGRVELNPVAYGRRPLSFRFDFPRDFMPGPSPAARRVGGAVDQESCLSFAGAPLSADVSATFDQPIVCRIRAENDDGTTAVIGVLRSAAPKSAEPLHEICAAEAMVWFEHIAERQGDVAICLAVGSRRGDAADVVVFERRGGRLLTLATDTGDRRLHWLLRAGTARDSDALRRYALIREWRLAPETRVALLGDALGLLGQNSGRFRVNPAVTLRAVEPGERAILFVLDARDGRHVGDVLGDPERDDLAALIADVACVAPLTAALLEHETSSYRFALYGNNGLMIEGPVPPYRCPVTD